MANIAEDAELEYFDHVREQLRYWPYTLHQIEDTLDIGLIEGRAKQTLFKAINSHNLVAFAGSGLSMSYGRLGWREWATEQQRVVGRNADAFCDLAKHSIELLDLLIRSTQSKGNDDPAKRIAGEDARRDVERISATMLADRRGEHFVQTHRHNAWQWLRNRHRAIENAKRQIERLADTFKLAKDGDGAFPGGEELPVKFEIAQQLHRQLRKHHELFVDADALDEGVSESLKKAWPGALQRAENSAPTEAIEWLREIIGLQLAEQTDESRAEERGMGVGEPPKAQFKFDTEGQSFIAESFHLSAATLLLSKQIKAFIASWETFHDLMARPEAKLSFEQLAKNLLVDECPHAMLLLRRGMLKNNDIDPEPDKSALETKDDQDTATTRVGHQIELPDIGSMPDKAVLALKAARKRMVALESELDLFNDSNLKRDIDGIREMPRRYRVLTPFKFEMFDQIRTNARISDGFSEVLWGGFTDRLEDLLEGYGKNWERAGDKRVYLTPMSRFLVPVYLAMCDDPFEALGVPEGKIPKDGKCLFEEPKREDFSSRRSIIADRFDPLAKAVRKLGIVRWSGKFGQVVKV